MTRFLLLSMMLGAPIALACDGEEGHAEAGKEEKGGEHCKMPSSETTAALPADGTHTTMTVSGMHCGACADKVHTALMQVPGVKGARVDLAAGTVEIAYDAGKTTVEKLKAAVTGVGFSATQS
jgi:copper chaperone CopZ